MIINVDNYVDYYIHYHHGKAANLISPAIEVFNEKYSQNINSLHSDMIQGQIDAVIKTMQAQGQNVSNGLEIALALENGNLLENTLDDIARLLNEGIGAYWNNINYEDVLRGAYSLSNMLENSNNVDIQKIQQFFHYLHEGLKLLGDEGKVDASTLLALTSAGRAMSKDPTFSLNWNDITTVDATEISVAKEIAKYMTKAAEKFGQGPISAQSFRGTISNIFNRSIGEPLSKVFVAQGLQYAENLANQTIDNTLVERSNGQLKWAGKSSPSLSSTKISASGGTSKADIINDDAFSLTTKINGHDLTIEVATNMSVKWHSSKRKRIQIVSNTTLGSLYKDIEEKTLAYNIIAHRKSSSAFNQAYRNIRAGTAAAFFNEWLSGSGSQLLGTSSIDKAQFLMINGKVYSVARIVTNICKDIETQGNNSAFRMDIQGIDTSINKWVGTPGKPSIIDAQKRSNYVNGVLNKLVVGCTLNSNILTKYAY